jgi:glycerophosphoryl diester phosphodiesterase
VSVERPSKPMVVAHRGASVEQPENTIEAFEAAIDAGADAVEFDVRMTADGVAVVMHDPDVSRTTNGVGLVEELTRSDVRRLRIPLPSDSRAG